jgi:thiol:disulfide interchange protein DsbD
MRRFLPWLLVWLFSAAPAFAQSGALPDARPKVVASLVAERSGIAPGGTVSIALKEIIRKDWHTYWLNPGDAGAPTSVKWHLPEGWHAGALQWPYPKRLPVEQLMDFGYEGEVALISEISAPPTVPMGDTVELAADVDLLVCSDICIPENKHLVLLLKVSAAPATDSAAAPLFAQTRAHLPRKSPWPARYEAADKRFALLLQNPAAAQNPPRDAVFYPYADGMVEAAAPERLGVNSEGLVIETAPGNKLASAEKRQAVNGVGGLLVLTDAAGQVTALDVTAAPGTVPPGQPLIPASSGLSLLLAIMLGVAGGLVLNFMPCVFPILSMKALALAAKREHESSVRASGLAYGAGAVASFLLLAGVLLAFRAAGAELGWGFQLQQPVFVAALALLMFAIGLNLSGLYEVRLPATCGKSPASTGVAGSFFTGVLAVLVATPCTAPFMGAALGYALGASPPAALAIFAALGLGFAAPFVALSFMPAAIRLLPRPGAWMVTLRQLLAFPMYGAAVWLVWVLSLQSGPQGVVAALGAALLLAFALWLVGRRSLHGGNRIESGAAALGLAGALLLLGEAAAGEPAAVPATVEAGALNYEAFSPARLAELQQAGRPVFVNATAAWCITCLVNEKLALSGERVARSFAAHNVAALKADWTTQDRAITALLARHGRSGVPLYLYFPPHALEPVILPQILTEASVVAAIGKSG